MGQLRSQISSTIIDSFLKTKFQKDVKEFTGYRVQKDWFEVVQIGYKLLCKVSPESSSNIAQFLELPSYEKFFWVNVTVEGDHSHHLDISVKDLLKGPGPTFAYIVNLPSTKLKLSLVVDLIDLSKPKLLLSVGNSECIERVNRTLISNQYISQYTLTSPRGEGALAVSPERELLAVGKPDGWLALIDAKTGQVLRELTGHVGDITCVSFFPSGQVLLSGGTDFQAKVYGIDGLCPVTLIGGHTRALTNLAMIARGRHVLTSGVDGRVVLWKVATASRLHTFTFGSPVVHMSAHHVPSSSLIDNDLTPMFSIDEAVGYLISVVLSSGKIIILDIVSGKNLSTFDCNLSLTCACVILPESFLIAAGSEDGTISLIDMCDNRVITSFRKSGSTSIKSISGSDLSFWVSYDDGTISRFDIEENGLNLAEEKLISDLDPVIDFKSHWALTRDGLLLSF